MARGRRRVSMAILSAWHPGKRRLISRSSKRCQRASGATAVGAASLLRCVAVGEEIQSSCSATMTPSLDCLAETRRPNGADVNFDRFLTLTISRPMSQRTLTASQGPRCVCDQTRRGPTSRGRSGDERVRGRKHDPFPAVARATREGRNVGQPEPRCTTHPFSPVSSRAPVSFTSSARRSHEHAAIA